MTSKYMLTCRDPTPRKDPTEDGNYILENMMDQHEPSELRGPAILDFLEKPTLKNAKAMLKIYNIHLPLVTLVNRIKPIRSKQQQEKYKQKQQPSPRKGGAPKQTLQYELLILDTMHDVLGTKPETMYNIFKNEIDLFSSRSQLKTMFLKSDYAFTRDAAFYIQQQGRIFLKDVYFDNQTKKANDLSLAKLISSWTSLTFVLDNFTVALQNNGGAPQSQSVLMLIGCSYLIVLLSNMKHLGMLSQYQNVTFVDGFFMKLDGSYVSRFFSLFLKSLSKLANLNTYIQPFKSFSKISKPKYFNMFFPGANASITQTHVAIFQKQYDVYPPNCIPNQVYYPHSKAEFAKHVEANPNNKELWYLNFLRDAFKADVAIETNSVFVTHDRLAFTYYKLAGGQYGFLLAVNTWTDANMVERCEYNVAF